MKTITKSLIIMFMSLVSLTAMAQIKNLTIRDIQFKSQTDLSNCDDVSIYEGDTVRVVAKVIADGNLIDVVSGQVTGGFRPFVHLVDTADNGSMGNFKGIQAMGVYEDAQGKLLPVDKVYDLQAGMIVELVGKVGGFNGETQLEILGNSDDFIKILSLGDASSIKPVEISAGDLNDPSRVNKITEGEEYEGSFVKIKDLTVVAVNNFNGNRVSFDVADANGNLINISDRYFVQKTKNYSTTRTNAPQKTGSFEPPVVGQILKSISGIVIHSENGCTGNATGRGYEINPFQESHYDYGATPPIFSNVNRTPTVPTSSDEVTIKCELADPDGQIVRAELYYATDLGTSLSGFTKVDLTQIGATQEFEAKIPASANGNIVRYYLEAQDDSSQISQFPPNVSDLTTRFYTVRDNGLSIEDIQKVLDPGRNDLSPYNGLEVTVTGVVAASAKNYDLGYIYLQDPNAAEWGGINVTGNTDLLELKRGQVVTVTGIVEENFGFTRLNVISVSETLDTLLDWEVNIPTINPSDSLMFANRGLEKYEGMLVQFVHPTGGKIFVNNANRSEPRDFAEFTVATTQDATPGFSSVVQTGRQSSGNTSSLWVSLVTDSSWAMADGEMQVPVVETMVGQTMDTLIGCLSYGFGAYKLTPRNNNDIKGFSVPLEEADYDFPIDKSSAKTLNLDRNLFSVYPNPTSDKLFVENKSTVKDLSIVITDLSGKSILIQNSQLRKTEVNTESLAPGTYILTIKGQGSALFVKQ